ncbi:MAG: Ig-like domain-containing protein [Gemmatimonadaceae bacterium]|nr:Ig-like domain-containing protein [Gemmatimonadaceae bacterium]
MNSFRRLSSRCFAFGTALTILGACGGGTADPVTPTPPPPPPPPPVASVASVLLQRDTATLVPQQSVQLIATTRDSAGNALSGRTVTWQSSATTIATVATDGTVIALAPGVADIVASSESRTATARITVRDGGLIGTAGGTVIAAGGNAKVIIPPGALSVPTPITVSPVVSPTSPADVVANTVYELGPSGTTFTQPVTLEFKYQRPNIDSSQAFMTMSRLTNGKWVPLVGSSRGTVTRVVRAQTRSFSQYGITYNRFLDSVNIAPRFPTVFFGQSLQLTARAFDVNGNLFSGPFVVTWTSPSEAPITSSGLIRGNRPGGPYLVHLQVRQWYRCEEPCYLGSYDYGTPNQVDIIVDSVYQDRTATAEIVVALIPVKVISVSPPQSSLRAGQKATLSATLKDSSGSALSAEYRTVTWSSSNSAIASVAQTGEVTAVSPGTATISATSEGVAGTATVTVSANASDVAAALVEPAEGDVEVGNTEALTVWPEDAAGNYLTGKPVTFSSRDVTRATVSPTGIVTGVSAGTVILDVNVDGYQTAVLLHIVPPYPLVTGAPGVGLNHACLLRSNGAVWCWGGGEYGQRGDGVKSARQPTPQLVQGGHSFQSLSVGGHRACALNTGGQAFCWGENQYGQLGDGTTIDKTTPVAVGGGRTFAKIFAGKLGGPGNLPTFSCGLESSGAAWCWGYGSFGNGNPAIRHTTPVRVTAVPDFIDLALGGTTACGLTATGEVWCFGDTNIPSRVASGHGFTAITGGLEHFCGLKTGGEAWCWGRNTYGQLGDGSTVTRTSPVKVASSVVFTALAGASVGTCALAADQTAWCWGIHGRNGDGTPPRGPQGAQAQSTPVRVLGGRRFTALSGGDLTCGRAADGTWCWGGLNFGGELGDVNSRYNAPVKIRFTSPP